VAVPERFVGAWVRSGLWVGSPQEEFCASTFDRELIEPADVIWLQGREWFADLRIPRRRVHVEPAVSALGARSEAFAGQCHWRACEGQDPDRSGALRWDHRVDIAGGFAGSDEGSVEWLCDGSFVERGNFVFNGIDHAFAELWTSPTGMIPKPLQSFAVIGISTVTDAPVSLMVMIGDRRITIIDPAANLCRSGGELEVQESAGGWRSVISDFTRVDGDEARTRSSLRLLDGMCAAVDTLPVGETVVTPEIEWEVVENSASVHGDVSLSKCYRNIPLVRSSP
jgi:hypothetical protein